MNLRGLPSVEQLLQTQYAAELIASYGRPLTFQSIRISLGEVRIRNSKDRESALPDRKILLEKAALPAPFVDIPNPFSRY